MLGFNENLGNFWARRKPQGHKKNCEAATGTRCFCLSSIPDASELGRAFSASVGLVYPSW